MLPAETAVDSEDEMNSETARKEIGEMYKNWGKARVTLNEEIIEAILAPEFYVLLDGEKISRQQFISMILQKRPNVQITRFDSDILTVQKADDEWTVVITEKVEVEFTNDDGSKKKSYSYWVTRDGCVKQGGKWIVNYSEAIGYERWKPGNKPPLMDWEK